MNVLELTQGKLLEIADAANLETFDFVADTDLNGVHIRPLREEEWPQVTRCYERFGEVCTVQKNGVKTIFLPISTLLEMEKWQTN